MQAADPSTLHVSNPAPMRRSEVLTEIEAMIFHRLFEGDQSLADRETAPVLTKRLEQLGLEERVPAEKDTWRSTALGRELHFDLLSVFLGLWDEWEVPTILEKYGVIDDLECEAIWDAFEAGRDPETILKKYVLKAYFAHYKLPKLMN
jgi:hypothetical protein